MSVSISSQDAHRQIWFRGAADLSTDDQNPSLLTRRNTATVLEQPFVPDFAIRRDILPTVLDIDSLSNHNLVAWIVFERPSLLKEAVHDSDRPLSVAVRENGDEYKRVICDVLDDGGFLCLPLMGLHVNETLRFDFDLTLQGDRPEIPYYAPGYRTFDVEVAVNESANSIELSWDDSTHIIKHQSGAPEPTLNAFHDQVDVSELAGMFFDTDPFYLPNHRSLAVKVDRPSLLHLVSR